MVNKLEITNETPMPKMRNRYPYESMEVGDSFLVDNISMQLVCNYNYRANKRLDRKFIARRTDDGIRVWRVD